MAFETSAQWNSLEIVKLIAGTLTPLAIVCLGIYVHRVSKRFENRQWLNQKLVEKRMSIYDEMGPYLNSILCYFTFVGRYREIDPPVILQEKRKLDAMIYLAAPFFPPEFFKACMDFQHECFLMQGEWDKSSQLRTTMIMRKKVHIRTWDDSWDKLFCEPSADPRKIQQLHMAIMKEFSLSFGEMGFVMADTSTRIPKGIQ